MSSNVAAKMLVSGAHESSHFIMFWALVIGIFSVLVLVVDFVVMIGQTISGN